MNILYLHCHDAGRWIEPYGRPVPTPNLSAFAAESTLFCQAFCCGPTCSPSRAALLTGMSAHATGMLGLAHRGFRIRQPERHLAAFLQRQGYTTALSGVQHEFTRGDSSPYTEYIQQPGQSGSKDFARNDRTHAELAAEFLHRRHDRPFFLSCGFFFPHREFPPQPDAGLALWDGPLPPSVPDTPATRRDMACYATAARRMDEAAGIVLRAVRESGRDRDTLVIVTTDHGIAFPGMKCHLFDAGIGVMLMIAYPGNPSQGAACPAMVSHLDVFPTICDLAGLPAPDWLEGRSLRPLFERSASAIREELFAEVTYHAGYEPQRCIRTPRHKLIRHYGDLRPNPVNVDDSPGKDILRDAGYFDRPRDPVQLYDLESDPEEQHNRADDPACAEIRRDLEARLDAWMRRTHDPLLQGPVPPPPEARINPRSHYSPGTKPLEPGAPE